MRVPRITMTASEPSFVAPPPENVAVTPRRANGNDRWTFHADLQLILCALGIYACYLRYGLLQERIYNTLHGPYDERFTSSSFLLLVQTATNASVAALVIFVTKFLRQSRSDHTEKSTSKFGLITPAQLAECALVSLSYLLAMLFSFTALRHMSYPMQALGKSCKMIPVMLMGIVIRRRRYSLREFICVGLITAGVAMFSWKTKRSIVPSSPLGFLLLFGSLFMDGVTGPLQERFVARHKPSTHQLMFWQNVCAVWWVVAGLLMSGEGITAIDFVAKYPWVMKDILAFALVSAIGQNFIFYTVRNFSALAVTTITTTRKMFTVLLSIFVYKHSMVARQWLGLVLVFSAISWEAIAKQKAKAAKAKAALAVNGTTVVKSVKQQPVLAGHLKSQ